MNESGGREKHSREVEGGRGIWYTHRLWSLAKNFPVRTVEIDAIPEFDLNCWFDANNQPTCRAVAEHARKIAEADLSHPIILSADGRLMDGGHRLCKAWLLGKQEIRAVQFSIDPEPDEIIPTGLE